MEIVYNNSSIVLEGKIMLIMFKVKNHTSFKNESVLDLRATSYTQHPTHIIKTSVNGINVLKTTAIYGANASGKSNFISAMYFFKNYIFSQFISKNEDIMADGSNKENALLEPFMLSANHTDSSEFEIIFIHNGKQIQYGFECIKNKIICEWYYINDKKVYERENESVLTYGKQYNDKLVIYNKVPSERLYISVLEYFLDDADKQAILGDFIDFFSTEFNVFSEILFESSVKKIAGAAMISKKLLEDKYFRKRVEEYLSKIDIGIKRLTVATIDHQKDDGKIIKQKIIKTVHDVYNANGEVVGEKEFGLNQESTGTIRFLGYIQNVIEMINRGGIFIVDEMSARLHPLLTKLIVDIFQSSKNESAQLIFTTHDISLLNHNQFRRDEVVFVDKNKKGESTLYALSDLKVREDATFSKDYLQGKYGAIPIFNYDSFFEGV